MGRQKRRARKARRKQERKQQPQVVQETVESDPVYPTDAYGHTFLEIHGEDAYLRPFEKKAARAFDKFIYKFKQDFQRVVEEAVAELPDPSMAKWALDKMDLAHKMDLVGNQLEVRTEVNGVPVVVLTQLQLLSRCSGIDEGFRVDGDFRSLPRERRNIFWLSVATAKLGACLLDVRNETYEYPPLCVVILNEGYHPDLDKRVDVHPTDKKRVTIED